MVWLFQRLKLNPPKAPSADPFGRGFLRPIWWIHRSYAVGRANGSPLWGCLLVSYVGGRWYFPYYSHRKKATEREFFVPAGTLIEVKLLNISFIHLLILRRIIT